jgi:hypothetical protein
MVLDEVAWTIKYLTEVSVFVWGESRKIISRNITMLSSSIIQMDRGFTIEHPKRIDETRQGRIYI